VNEEIRELLSLLNLFEEVQDLRLHRHIEGAGRLVKEQELRFRRQSPRNRDPLTLAPENSWGKRYRCSAEDRPLAADGHLFVRLQTGRKTLTGAAPRRYP